MSTHTLSKAKRVYAFGGGGADGGAAMKELLGGKGANLAEMSALGLPVPPGFTITTEVCNQYYAASGAFPAGLEAEVRAALAQVEGLSVGSSATPQIRSWCRSVPAPGRPCPG